MAKDTVMLVARLRCFCMGSVSGGRREIHRRKSTHGQIVGALTSIEAHQRPMLASCHNIDSHVTTTHLFVVAYRLMELARQPAASGATRCETFNVGLEFLFILVEKWAPRVGVELLDEPRPGTRNAE
jgi:hypothetical protein